MPSQQNDVKDKFAEIQYFFLVEIGSCKQAVALVSVFSEPDKDLLQKSSGALTVCRYEGSRSLKIIDAKCIKSVVAMVPFWHTTSDKSRYFLIEKFGLEIFHMAGAQEDPGDS